MPVEHVAGAVAGAAGKMMVPIRNAGNRSRQAAGALLRSRYSRPKLLPSLAGSGEHLAA